MEDYKKSRKNEEIYSKRIKAGKKRTYFIDVRMTRENDYYLTITESKRKHNDGGFIKHKIFLYKEDFNKFQEALNETIDHVKSELITDFDFDKFNNDDSTITKVEGEDLGEYDENISEESVEQVEQTQAKNDTSEEKDPFNLESNEKYEADIDIDFSLNNKD